MKVDTVQLKDTTVVHQTLQAVRLEAAVHLLLLLEILQVVVLLAVLVQHLQYQVHP
jgi:hypothetical protein